MTLPELLETYRRRATEAAAVGASAPVSNVYESVVADLAPLINGNGSAPAIPRPDRLLTAKDVAPRLSCSPRYLYAHAADYPFTVRLGNLVRFSEQGLERYVTGRGEPPRTPHHGSSA